MAAGRPGLTDIAHLLDGCRASILARWRDRVRRDASLQDTSEWTRKQFYDHFPDVLEAYGHMLRRYPAAAGAAESDQFIHAHAHAKTRWLQGYALGDLVREWGHFNTAVVVEFARLRQGAAAGAADFGLAETLWAELASAQMTEGVQEYERLHRAEAATRAEELAGMLERVRALGRTRAASLGRTAATLRNDLSTLLTSNTLMANGLSGPDAAELQALARDSIASLDRSLADMILLARLEAGLQPREITDCDVGQALSSVITSLEPQARQANCQLTSCGPTELAVESDAHAVGGIVQHLVLTGLLSDTPGPVDVEWGDDPREPERWRLIVRQHLLQRSTQSSPPIARALADATDRAGQARGSTATGVEAALQDGLIPVAANDGSHVLIAKHLCELLDASIELTAEEGVVTFRMSFPRRYGGTTTAGEAR